MITGEARIGAALSVEVALYVRVRDDLAVRGCAATHMSARVPGTSDIRCPECAEPWPCSPFTMLARDYLGIADIEAHLELVARNGTNAGC